MRELYKAEVKKILEARKVFLILLAACIGLNIYIAYVDSPEKKQISYVNDLLKNQTGIRMGEVFTDKLEQARPRKSEEELWKVIKEDTKDLEDVFVDYNAVELAGKYGDMYSLDEESINKLKEKYTKLQPIIDEKAVHGDSLDAYLLEYTAYEHKQLFHVMIGALLVPQMLLIMVLSVLFMTGYEFQNKTAYVVYSCKTGRKVAIAKLLSGLLNGLVYNAVLCLVSLTAFFLAHDFSAAWKSNVSSVFNVVMETMIEKPFMTWASFTLRQYFLLTLLFCFLLSIVFGILAFGIGMMIKNTYIGFLIFIVTAFGMVLLTQIKNPAVYFLARLTPVGLVLKSYEWFTEGGGDVSISWFETKGLIGCTIIAIILAVMAFCNFKRRDL